MPMRMPIRLKLTQSGCSPGPCFFDYLTEMVGFRTSAPGLFASPDILLA
jgi:hypothetical protein